MKKLLCFVLSLVMILSVAAVPTVAEVTETPNYPTGANKITLAVKDGVAPEEINAWADINTDYYKSGATWYIEDATDMLYFSAISNIAGDSESVTGSFKEQTVYLAKSIDMTGITSFKPICQQASCAVFGGFPIFRGIFDGQGFSIKNLSMTSDTLGVGLFGTVAGAAVIKNLVIDASCSFTYTGDAINVGVGSLISWLHTDANNLVADTTGLTVNTGVSVGAAVVNVQSYATVTSTKLYAAGLIGHASHGSNVTMVIQKCTFGGSVYGKLGAAGVMYSRNVNGSHMLRQFDINNCTVSGNVTSDGKAVGIVVNASYTDTVNAKKTSIRDCFVTATIKGSEVTPISDAEILNYDNTIIATCDTKGATLELTSEIGYDYKSVEKKDLSSVASIQTLTPSNSARAYKIETPADLVYLSNYVNGLAYSGTSTVTNAKAALYGYTIYLANNLDMTGVSMKAIGSVYNQAVGDYPKNTVQYFAGTFDGQGYTIDNLKVTSDITEGVVYLGLFGALRSATVKNVVLGAGCEFTYDGALTVYAGAIAGMNHSVEPNMAFRIAYGINVFVNAPASDILNCYSAATVSVKGYAGGIVGLVEHMRNSLPGANIFSCTNVGQINGGNYAGGIVGFADRSVNVVNCRNAGVVEGTTGAGGVVGLYNSTNDKNAIVSNCVNNGVVSGSGFVGGIAGKKTATKSAIANCVNYSGADLCGDVASGSEASIHGNVEAAGTVDTEWTAVKFVGAQTKKDADSYSVRFLATVNDLSVVKSAGFRIEITYNGVTKTVDPLYATRAYDSVYFETNGVKDAAYAGAYNGVYFVSAVITDVPNGADVTFNVKTIENGTTAAEGVNMTFNSGNAVA